MNTRTGEAIIDETIPLRVRDNIAIFDIHHFSGYLVSTGRSGTSAR